MQNRSGSGGAKSARLTGGSIRICLDVVRSVFEEDQEMLIREYVPSDCERLAELFFQTVHAVNARDYTEIQLNAWATGTVDLPLWNQLFSEHYTLVAVDGDTILGFGDIDDTGYLDKLYVHKDHQRQGVATALCDKLEAGFDVITTHASITAKPFFLHRGYKVIKEQHVVKNGVSMTNYVMEKQKDPGLPE